MRQRKKYLVFAFGLFFTNVFYFNFTYKYLSANQQNSKASEDFSKNPASLNENSQLKHVLFYTKFFKNENWHIGNETVGREHPHMQKCSKQNCIFTNRKRYLPALTDYDAVVFHTGEPWIVNGKYWYKPKFRKPNQLYIVAVQE